MKRYKKILLGMFFLFTLAITMQISSIKANAYAIDGIDCVYVNDNWVNGAQSTVAVSVFVQDDFGNTVSTYVPGGWYNGANFGVTGSLRGYGNNMTIYANTGSGWAERQVIDTAGHPRTSKVAEEITLRLDLRPGDTVSVSTDFSQESLDDGCVYVYQGKTIIISTLADDVQNSNHDIIFHIHHTHQNSTFVHDSNATCTANGTGHYTCWCGTNHSYGTVWQNALGHSWEWKTDSNATCATDGLKHQYCTRCGATQAENTVWQKKTGHKWTTSTITKAPTIYSTGIRTYTCETCKKKVNQTEPKYALNIAVGKTKLKGIAKGSTKLYVNTTVTYDKLPFVISTGTATAPDLYLK